MELSITDSGPGIPVAEQTRVFDMFYQVTEGDRQRAGTGLGLAMVRKLLAAMSSEIRFESAAGRGTRFYFELELPTVPHL